MPRVVGDVIGEYGFSGTGVGDLGTAPRPLAGQEVPTNTEIRAIFCDDSYVILTAK